MQMTILQSDTQKRGLVFDPRTKLFLLMTMAVFVLGGLGGKAVLLISPLLCLFPILLLITSKKYKTAVIYVVVYTIMYFTFHYFGPKTSGILNFLILGTAGIITRFMPSVMLGVYVVSTTTVSEFTAAMLRMHLSEKIIIPMSVMFRFFPTVADEFSAINAAMRMRGIAFGGKNAGKMIEYRLVPLLTCSAKIGEELSAAALTRGLGGNVKRTNICDIGFHIQDMLVILLCLVPFAIVILSRFGFM